MSCQGSVGRPLERSNDSHPLNVTETGTIQVRSNGSNGPLSSKDLALTVNV